MTRLVRLPRETHARIRHTMLTGACDARLQWECERAAELVRTGITRSEALRQAANEYDGNRS